MEGAELESAQQQQVHSKDASRIFRVRRTVLEMLRDRKYTGFETEEMTQGTYCMTFDKFQKKFSVDGNTKIERTKMDLIVSRVDDPNQKLIVFFTEENKVPIKTMTDYVKRMESRNFENCIIVLRDGISPQAKTAAEKSQRDKRINIEIFKEDELLINITQHTLVPKHEVLDADKKRELMERYKLEDTQLPRMQQNDPVARYFGLKFGQVVKITRPSETAGRYVTYRIVL